jgi:hypothetical protein
MGNNKSSSLNCALCGSRLTFHYRPMPEWNITGMICGQCYDKKLLEHYIAPYRNVSQEVAKTKY